MTGSDTTGTSLITATELAQAMAGSMPPTVLDVRWRLNAPDFGRMAYHEGHIPGAVYCDLDTVLSGPPGSEGRHPLPDLRVLADWFGAAGVSGDRGVCVYDEREPAAAARAWWSLKYLGHPDVRLLDGGIHAWRAGGRPVTDQSTSPTPGRFVARMDPAWRLDDDLVEPRARAGRLLDARAADRYSGATEGVDPVAGHIPGALSSPLGETFSPEGRFKPAAELRAQFDALAGSAESPVAVYCGSGVTAAAEMMALELAGFRSQLFVGSWSKWVAESSRPVATGSAPGSWPE